MSRARRCSPGIVEPVSPRLRVTVVVATAAAAAAGATVGATVLTSRGETGAAAPTAKPRAGVPPLVLDLGVRTDPEARALRRASTQYEQGRTDAAKRREAERIFARYSSTAAEIGAAFADWPDGLAAVERIARAQPRSALAQLHLGLALYWRGELAQARAAWRKAETAQPDTSYAVRAADLLHPEDAPGLPPFTPTFSWPAELARLSPPRQLAYLAARAARGGVRDKLLYGVALQRLGRPVSAEREFAAAARLAPGDPEARVAAAVGRFDKDRPARAFAELGPLTRAFPHAPTVRFHLALLLLWLGRVDAARTQFRLARAEAPTSPLAREADRFLARLVGVKAKGGTR